MSADSLTTSSSMASGGSSSSTSSPEVRVRSAIEVRDFRALQQIAFSPNGFGSMDSRRMAWSFLLGLTDEEVKAAQWNKEGMKDCEAETKDVPVIEADVERSVYSWDVHVDIEESVREQKRAALKGIMCSVLGKHSKALTYFQGFHDIALVFLEMGSEAQAFHMVERVALFHMSDQLCWPFQVGVIPMLRVFLYLLKVVDPDVATALVQAGCSEVHFALPWVLTWFAHSLPKLHEQVMRLFDCLLSSHPLVILYFCTALLVMHRKAILEANRELPDMMCALQGLALETVNVDDWAAEVGRMLKEIPPEDFLCWRLPWRLRFALPPTSPLRNFPHPWMESSINAAAISGEQLKGVSGSAVGGHFPWVAPIYRERPLLVRWSQAGLAGALNGAWLRRWRRLKIMDGRKKRLPYRLLQWFGLGSILMVLVALLAGDRRGGAK